MKNHSYTHISVAIPMMDESSNMVSLLDRLQNQTIGHVSVYLCINQPDSWWNDGSVDHLHVCEDNQWCLSSLASSSGRWPNLDLSIIDRSSLGQGWDSKRHGVGWARKELFSKVMSEKYDDEIVVSLDADTDFDTNYLESVLATFNDNPTYSALSVPYYHPLRGNDDLDRPMLRYECYMRHYLVHLLRIGSPYAFTALGSAIAFPLWAYKRVGGITPLQGGEDFYLLQKFAKTGLILNKLNNGSVVRPQGRISSRVPFGTGPAIAKGVALMDEAYPFYSSEGFRAIEQTFSMFPILYEQDVETPMTAFLQQQLAAEDLWSPLRKNFKAKELFVHACQERVDGLRILQFLKNTPSYRLPSHELPVDFLVDSIGKIDAYRNSLFDEEMSLR